MSNLLQVSEIVGFAVHIEQNGYAFYTETAKKFNDPKLMDLFHFMAEEELRHEKTFSDLQKTVGEYTPPESYRDEYETYMKDFLKGVSPKTNEAMKERVAKVEDLMDAINTAIGMEKDSIVFYSTLKRYVDDKNKGILNTIIEEEVSHLLKLHNFKNNEIPAPPDVDAL